MDLCLEKYDYSLNRKFHNQVAPRILSELDTMRDQVRSMRTSKEIRKKPRRDISVRESYVFDLCCESYMYW